MALKRLTDISTSTGVTLLDFIHIVNTGDTSQYPSGSSYKATLQQVADSFSGLFTFTGNTSGDCITDLFVSDVNSCSPLHIQNKSNGNVLIGENGGVNVGIGTSTPSYRVHIMAADASNPVLLVRDNTNTFDIASIKGDGYTTVRGFNIGSSVNTYAVSNYTTLNGTATIQQYNKNLYFTTTDSVLENLLIYSDGSAKVRSSLYVGDVVDTTARIYVRGTDNTSSNYGLKVQNSGGTDNFVVRNDGNVGIGTSSPSSKLHIDGNNSSNGSYIRATQRTTGVGTISASQGTGPIYSAYTRIDGVGTSFSNDLTYGESITSSGFTLGIYQIINNTLLYATLNTGATFSNQPYTLQGNSRFEVGNNYFNVGNGNLVAYDNGSSIFIGTSALGGTSNRYRGLSFGAENGTFVYCDISNNNVQIPKRVYINGTSAGNTSYLSVGGDGTFSTKYIGLQGNGSNASTMFVIGQQDSNYNTTMRFSHRPEQYGYYYYAYGVSQNNASSIGIGTDPTYTHRLTVSDGLKLISTPFNQTTFDIKQATDVSLTDPTMGNPIINAYSANTIYGLRTVLNGTNIATNLNVGETITASGVTLTVSEKVDDNTLYTTYNSLAQFTGYSYTLQGLSRFNVLNNGNVGIGITTPSEKLEVNGKIKTSTLQVSSGATSGYVLTATDSNGNMSWQQPQDSTALGTGLTIHFSGKTVFNLPSSPASGNISGDTTNAKLGMIQKIYHQDSVEPTFPVTWKLVGEGVYFTNELNIIYAEYVEPTWIEYWIIQLQ